MPSSMYIEALEQRSLLSAQPYASVGDAYCTEGDTGNTTAAVVVTLSQPRSNQEVTVAYSTQNGSATAGADYLATSGKLTFNKGEISKTLYVTIKGDHLAETNEYFVMNLQGVKNTKIADGRAIINITDDEPYVSIDNPTAVEGDSGTSALNFTVTLSRPYDQAVTVNFSTQNGDALAGVNYVAASAAVTFAPGETSKTILVSIIGNLVAGPDTSFSVNLQTGTNAKIANGQGIGTIVDDEPHLSIIGWGDVEGNSGAITPFTFTISLSKPLNQPLTVDYTTEDYTAFAGIDYEAIAGSFTFAPGETTKTVTVQVYGNDLLEPDKYFVVKISATNIWLTNSQDYGNIFDDDGYYYDPGYYYDGDYYYYIYW